MRLVVSLYGYAIDDIELAKVALEKMLGATLSAHDSLYYGGAYYRYGQRGEDTILLRRNIDPIDNEPAELDFPDLPIIVYLDLRSTPGQLERLLDGDSSEFIGLRRAA
jgi:hypothetical protein